MSGVNEVAPKRRLTAGALSEALPACRGNLAAVARAFGVTRTAVYLYVKRHPSLLAVVQEAREAMRDVGESSLYDAVGRGEPWAVKFYLSTQARDRGYGSRTEHRAVTDADVDAEIARALAALAGHGQAPGAAAAARPRDVTNETP
jgi:hypothetical protein